MRRCHCRPAGVLQIPPGLLPCLCNELARAQVIQDEGLVQRADEMGHAFRSLHEAFFATVSDLSIYFYFRAAMTALQSKGCSFIAEVRGRGLLNAVEVDPSKVMASSPSVSKSILFSKYIFNVYFHLMLFASGVGLGIVHQNGLKRAASEAHPCALHRRRSTVHRCSADH